MKIFLTEVVFSSFSAFTEKNPTVPKCIIFKLQILKFEHEATSEKLDVDALLSYLDDTGEVREVLLIPLNCGTCQKH